MIKNNKGFTLIELLVVIAIIGILSGIVISSVGTARTRANDASVKSNLAGIRAQAEIYQGGSVGNSGPAFTAATCPTSGTSMFYADSTIARAIAAATSSGSTVSCVSTTSAWAVAGLLPSSGGTATTTNGTWCVDSTGASKEATALAASAVVCP